ncbi:MAG: hypothetical protein ACPGUV_15140 [Polyangiales bacterium]
MASVVKFSSKIQAQALEELRELARSEGRTLAALLTEAVRSYLDRAQVRPPVKSALEEVMRDHDVLLARLAK